MQIRFLFLGRRLFYGILPFILFSSLFYAIAYGSSCNEGAPKPSILKDSSSCWHKDVVDKFGNTHTEISSVTARRIRQRYEIKGFSNNDAEIISIQNIIRYMDKNGVNRVYIKYPHEESCGYYNKYDQKVEAEDGIFISPNLIDGGRGCIDVKRNLTLEIENMWDHAELLGRMRKLYFSGKVFDEYTINTIAMLQGINSLYIGNAEYRYLSDTDKEFEVEDFLPIGKFKEIINTTGQDNVVGFALSPLSGRHIGKVVQVRNQITDNRQNTSYFIPMSGSYRELYKSGVFGRHLEQAITLLFLPYIENNQIALVRGGIIIPEGDGFRSVPVKIKMVTNRNVNEFLEYYNLDIENLPKKSKKIIGYHN